MTSQDDHRHGRHLVSALHVHLVCMTSYWPSVRHDQMLNCCQTPMRTCNDFDAQLSQFNGERGHVHLLMLSAPKVAVPALENS